MKKILTLLATAWIFVPLGLQLQAIAVTSRDVPINFAQRGTIVKVTPEGVSIDLGSESISGMTITDRRDILVKQIGNSIYLQRIEHQAIDGLLGSRSGTSVLRVWTSSGKRLIFNLYLGMSGATDIAIVPANVPPYKSPVRLPLKPSIHPSSSAPSEVKLPPTQNISYPSQSPYPLLNLNFSTKTYQPKQSSVDSLTVQSPDTDSSELEKSRIKAQRKAEKAELKAAKEAEKQQKQRQNIDENQSDNRTINVGLSKPLLGKTNTAVKFDTLNPDFNSIETESIASNTALTFGVASRTVEPTKVLTALNTSSNHFKLSLSQAQAKAILFGLNKAKYAKGKDKIAYLSPVWDKTQDVIYRLKKGDTLARALQKTGSSKPLIDRLLKEGGFEPQ